MKSVFICNVAPEEEHLPLPVFNSDEPKKPDANVTTNSNPTPAPSPPSEHLPLPQMKW